MRHVAIQRTGEYRLVVGVEARLVLPAYEFCLKCSHVFNVLDSAGGVGVSERTAYILKIRQLAVAIAQAYVAPAEPGEAVPNRAS